MTPLRAILASLAAAACVAARADLTLEDALRIARENNGTARAAELGYRAAQADARAAFSAFLPTVSPTLRQENGRLQNHTGLGRGGSNIDTTDASISASWTLLDNGTRGVAYRQSQLARDAAEAAALDSLRTVLFNVQQSFYDALRSQELLAVQAASVVRAKEILDRATLSEEVGAGPKKDILQAKADYLNAQVNELAARNQVSTTRSALWAVIAYPEPELPRLSGPADAQPAVQTWTLEEATRQALENRPDLRSGRIRVQAAESAVRAARLEGSIDFSLSARYDKSFSESVFDRSGLVLQASFPLYDGSRSRERVRSAQLERDAQAATYLQAERNARAEVESAYKAYAQNAERLSAARLALEAARLNYQAASDARKEGAGDLIEELTAQVSLVTAESNFVQAVYDVLISEARLRLVTGQPMPGEQP